MAKYFYSQKIVFLIILQHILLASANNSSKFINLSEIDWEHLEEQVGLQYINSEHSYDDRNRWRYRYRYRWRHRLATLNSANLENQNTFPNATKMFEDLTDDLTKLSDQPSIKEYAVFADPQIVFPSSEQLSLALSAKYSLLSDIHPNSNHKLSLESKVLDALTSTLKFYEAHLHQLNDGDTAVGLMMLKGIDDKHGKVLQKRFPLERWINIVCASTGTGEENDENVSWCKSLGQKLKNRSGNKPNHKYWKSPSSIQNYVNKAEKSVLDKLGEEKEVLWAPLNGKCQTVLVAKCENPLVCERTLLDPTPRSQYFLTHQIFHRILVETLDCPGLKSIKLEDETYNALCAKGYMEAEYLDLLNFPPVHRDLFAELVGFCGVMGYSNFLREDWLDKILSWQSKSKYGCFANEPLFRFGIITTDIGFERRATHEELQDGVQSQEKCLPHFTSVSLTALSVYWDYLMDYRSY